ncbi:MAG: hypothetical protein A2X82_19995 [Geobacteraceae bacterium GWC2_55_20]|nr:MAG: hypothetical protein A2X82_19995 [Geobacteraceae bacterium GWC2_55_20]HBA72472.1 DUF948 domain-containing protein [Geobacter sp.]HCE66469.1 DUF948 domain-containing protein [Geobacter sp.]
MTLTGIALIIITIAICILVMTLIPTILTVKRTFESVGALSEMVQKELKPTIQELTGVLAELKTVGGGVAEHTDDVKRFMSALGETGDNLHTINHSVGVVTNVLNTTSVWATGAKVAGKYVLERYLKKRGGN